MAPPPPPPPAAAAGSATGCFKCGRPGHWSRDCPSSSSSSSSAPPSLASPQNRSATAPSSGNWKNPSATTGSDPSPSSSSWRSATKAAPKPPAIPRKRPKLTPDLLLSNEGLGYVLEHFPRMVKIQGAGHELEDLKSLLEAYVHWHSRILPYFSFDQFVERVEKVGSTRRVRLCLNDLKSKVAMGEEMKLNPDDKTTDEGKDEMDMGTDDHDIPNENENDEWDEPADAPLPEAINEDLFDEFYKQAIDESVQPKDTTGPATTPPLSASSSAKVTEDQRSRMEANRLKALERAKARIASSNSAAAS